MVNLSKPTKASAPYGNMQQTMFGGAQQPMFNGMGVNGQSMSGPPPMAGQQGPTGIPILDDFWEDFTTPPSFLDGLLHFPGGILEAQKYYKHKDEIMPYLDPNNWQQWGETLDDLLNPSKWKDVIDPNTFPPPYQDDVPFWQDPWQYTRPTKPKPGDSWQDSGRTDPFGNPVWEPAPPPPPPSDEPVGPPQFLPDPPDDWHPPMLLPNSPLDPNKKQMRI